MQAWIILFIAGVFEIVWAVGLKYTEGFTKLWPSVVTGGALVASMLLLAAAVRQLPIGTAYSVWVGIGAVGTALYGICYLGESTSPLRMFFLTLLVASIIGLKLSTKG